MPVTVKDVLQLECLSQARVVAGKRGLDREVYWITVGEEPDLPEWIFGGELILSTLFAVEPERRGEHVKRLSDRGVAGLIKEVAGLLHVPKHPVRYRLRRITELTGLDVARFEDATQLYLAVRATELL